MLYNYKIKSLYEVFNYSKEIIDITLSTFIKEERLIPMLKKAYGSDYCGSSEHLSYYETQLVDGILKRVNARLEAVDILTKQGKSKEAIIKLFNSKSDVDIINIINNLHNNAIVTKKATIVYKNQTEILNHFNITNDFLSELVQYISDYDQRMAFEYTYGINRKIIPVDTLIKILKVTKNEYIDLLKKTFENFDELIKKTKDGLSMLEVTVSEPVKKEKVKLQANLPKRHCKVERTSLFNYFITDEMTDEEIQEIKEKIIILINKTTSKEVKVCKKIYGENLDTFNDIPLTKEEKEQLKMLIRNIRSSYKNYLSDNSRVKKNIESKKSEKKVFFKDSLLDYFEGIENASIYVEDYYNNMNSRGNDIVKKYYNSEFRLYNFEYPTDEEKMNFRNAIYSIKKKIEGKRISIKNRHDNFIEYFDESIYARECIMDFLNNSRSAGVIAVKKMFDENLNRIPGVVLDDIEKKNFYNAILLIKQQIIKRSSLVDPVREDVELIKTEDKEEVKVSDVKKSFVDLSIFGENISLLVHNHLMDIEVVNKLLEDDSNDTEQQLYNLVVSKIEIENIIINMINNNYSYFDIMNLLGINCKNLKKYLINLLPYLNDKDLALKFILTNEKNENIIKLLMSSPLYVDAIEAMPEIERELLFLKLVQVSSETLTDELIARILSLDVEDVINYRIFINSDDTNNLSNYFRKR